MKSSTHYWLNAALAALALLFTQQISFAHWTTKGPYGGSVKTLLVADTTIFVGTYDGGVYRSTTSQGVSWRYANYAGLGSGHINALAASGNLVFAATADAGIFVSSNLGAAWSSINNGLTNLHVLTLITSGSTLLAGTDGGGVFVSTNNGTTWAASNSGLTNQTVTALVAGSGAVFAGTSGGGVFFSLNNGASWTALNTGLSNLSITALALSGTTLIAGTDGGIFSASTLTPSWTAAGLANVTINSLAVIGTNVYAATSAGVFSSAVPLVAWSAINNGYTGSVNAVVSINNKLIAGTQEDGIIKSNSTTTVSWAKSNTGFNNLTTSTVYNSGSLVITATNKGLFVSRDLAANYLRANVGLTDSLHVTALTFGGGDLYAATEFGGVFVSADTGTTWTAVNDSLPSLSIRHLIGSDDHLVAAASNGQVFLAHIDEPDWAWETATGLPGGIVVTSLATDGELFFLGTDGNGVFYSEDPEDWSPFNTGLTNLQVTSLAVLNGSVYAGTSGSGVFKSAVANAGWSTVNNGLPTLNITALHASGYNVVAGYKGGVYTTYNGGDSWLPPNIILYIPEYADVKAISYSETSTRIFIATPNNSLYSNSLAEIPTATNDLAKAGGRLLISPNPTQGQFQLDLQNVDADIDEVLIYDPSGRVVQRFVYQKNQQRISISALCPPGIYALSVRTNKGFITQKLVIE